MGYQLGQVSPTPRPTLCLQTGALEYLQCILDKEELNAF